jgi:hypothetical protein
MMHSLLKVFLSCLAIASAGPAHASDTGIANGLVIRADWQEPAQVPPRFRNHCRVENFTGRPYCSDHCGSDYQFYFCSELSFGCCHLGRGYCDFRGLVRCVP